MDKEFKSVKGFASRVKQHHLFGKTTLNLCYCHIFSCAFRARNMQTKCGAIFPPTSSRNPSSKSWNCLQSTLWVKGPPTQDSTYYTHHRKRNVFLRSKYSRDWCLCVRGRGHFCKCEQKYLFYFVRKQLSRCPAEPSSTNVGWPKMQMGLAPLEAWMLVSPPVVSDFYPRSWNGNAEFFLSCVSNSRTATTATRTNLRFVMCVTWSSPPPWWPSRTTRAKFTPRTWGWSPLVHRLQVCITSVLLASFVPSFLFLFLLLLVSCSRSNASSSPGPEETSRGSQRRAGRRRRRQQRLQPFLLHVPGVVQQPAHGPAALRRQEAQKADDKDEADGDVRAGHGSRSEHTAASEVTSRNTCPDSLLLCDQLPRWRATPAPSVRLSWTLWSSTSLTSAVPNTITSKYTHRTHYLVCFSTFWCALIPFIFLKSEEVEPEHYRKPKPCRTITGRHQPVHHHGRPVCYWG